MQRIVWAILGLLLLLPAQAQQAEEAIRVQQSLGGPVRALALDGTDALLAEGASILRLPLLGDQAYQPSSRLSLDAPILALAQHPAALYALTENGIHILSPDGREQGAFVPAAGERLHLYADWLALTAGSGGARLFLVQQDGSLQPAGQTDTPGTARDALLQGDFIVADGVGGIRFYRPPNFSLRATLPSLTPAQHLAATPERFYAATDRYVAAFDSTPLLQGVYAPVQQGTRLITAGQWLLVADSADGLKVYDRATLSYQYGQINRPAADLALLDSLLLAAEADGLHIYRLDGLPQLQELQHLRFNAPLSALAANEDYILVAVEGSGLHRLSSGDFQPLGRSAFEGRVSAIVLRPPFAYAALRDGRLLTIDLRDDRVLHTLALSGDPSSLALDGQQLAVAAGVAGTYLLSLEDGAAPRIISRLPAADAAWGVHFPGPQQLAVQSEQHLTLWSLADPTSPVPGTRYPLATGRSMAQLGSTLYSAGGNQLHSFAYSAPQQLSPLRHYQAPQQISGLLPLTGELIISSRNPAAAFVRLDTRNPAQPREIEVRPLGRGIEQFTLRGDDLLALDTEGDFWHWRVVRGQRSTQAGRYSPPGRLQALAGQGDELLLMGAGLWRYDAATQAVQALSASSVTEAAWLDEAVLLLTAEGDLLLSMPDEAPRTIFTGNAVALSAAPERWWFVDSAGSLYQYAPEMRQPQRVSSLEPPLTALVWFAEAVIVGDGRGALWQWQAGELQPLPLNLGQPITSLAAQGEQLAIGTTGGLWLLDSAFNLLAQQELPSAAAAIAPYEGAWLLANGACGLRFYDAALREQGSYRPAAVNDVAVLEGSLWISSRGLAQQLQLSPEAFAPPPEDALRPQALFPIDGSNPRQPVRELRWGPPPDRCTPLQYEVWVQGQQVATLNQAHYSPAEALVGATEWQVVLLRADGSRIEGPRWHFDAGEIGWLNAPQRGPALDLSAPPQDKGFSPLWGGLLLGLLGLVGLLWLGRVWYRQQQR